METVTLAVFKTLSLTGQALRRDNKQWQHSWNGTNHLVTIYHAADPLKWGGKPSAVGYINAFRKRDMHE